MSLLKWLQNKTKYRLSSDNVFTPTLQEDTRIKAQHKRVVKAFEDQQQQMQLRAMKAHAADCPDPWTCTRNPCFKWEPDKIVGEPKIIKIKTKKERLNNKLDI